MRFWAFLGVVPEKCSRMGLPRPVLDLDSVYGHLLCCWGFGVSVLCHGLRPSKYRRNYTIIEDYRSGLRVAHQIFLCFQEDLLLPLKRRNTVKRYKRVGSKHIKLMVANSTLAWRFVRYIHHSTLCTVYILIELDHISNNRRGLEIICFFKT